jgi:hypothetical protein
MQKWHHWQVVGTFFFFLMLLEKIFSLLTITTKTISLAIKDAI